MPNKRIFAPQILFRNASFLSQNMKGIYEISRK